MKILYNVTIKISTDLHIEWLEWMKRVHIPEVMATGCFESYRITRILGDDDEHGVGFAVQQQHAKRLQQEHSDRYANQYVSFRTLMKIEAEG